MSDAPLMPKATAVWLIDNTSLTFDQIAEFCHLHPLEVSGIADGDVASGVRGIDPITQGQLTREEIAKGEENPAHKLKLTQKKIIVPTKSKKSPRYTPLSKRQNRPDAIAWMVRNHPEVTDAQISKLLGTTKNTIQSIRDRSHWNMANLEPLDPVSLGLCSQIDLDAVVSKAAAKQAKLNPPQEEGPTLRPAEVTTEQPVVDGPVFPETAPEEQPDLSKVFENFGGDD